jgi:polyisoprenoid-binding protein YceI
MNTHKWTLAIALSLVSLLSQAQVKYHAKDDVHVTISGTSTLHDWDMTSATGDANATFTFNAGGQLTGLSFLSFAMPAESLKSGHGAMDKNAYKSLQTDKNKAITYNLTSAIVQPDGTIKCTGKLMIAGVAQNANLTATAKVNADQSISVKVSDKISMKDFSIDPPTFMMGAVKTGNDVTVNFELTFKKS